MDRIKINEIVKEVVDKYINRNLINEYEQIPFLAPKEAQIMKGVQVWVYKQDRDSYTPHLHLLNNDGNNIEISLINFSIIKINKCFNKASMFDMLYRFKRWTKKFPNNKIKLFELWDTNNTESIENFIARNNIELNNIDSKLLEYIKTNKIKNE